MIQDMSGGDTMAMWPHIHPHLIATVTQWADIQIYNLGGSLALVSSAASWLNHNYITKVENSKLAEVAGSDLAPSVHYCFLLSPTTTLHV